MPKPVSTAAFERLSGMPLAESPASVALTPNWCLFVNEVAYPDTPAVYLAQMSYPSDTVVW
jgi:hypothetical protein